MYVVCGAIQRVDNPESFCPRRTIVEVFFTEKSMGRAMPLETFDDRRL
jgi:hypothetical protein